MKIVPYLVDWSQASEPRASNTLVPSLKTTANNAIPLDFPDSYHLYMTIAEAYEQMRAAMPETMRDRVDQFMHCLITFDGYCQDLGSCTDIALSVSPESALKLAYIGNQINWQGFQSVYYSRCENYIKESLAEFKKDASPDQSFEKVFSPYIQLWLKMLNTAAVEDRGIVVLWN